MTDFEAQRVKMVDGQIRTNSVTDHHLLSAFLATPRERFVPASLRHLAYTDQDILIGGASGRALIEVMPLARLIQALELGKDDVVLDVACASGYSTAILGQVAGSVLGVDNDADLVARATEILAETGVDNAVVVEGDPKAGLVDEAPYDGILIGGAVDAVPEAILAQLKDGGRLATIVGRGGSARATLFVRDGDTVSSRFLFNCAVPMVPGFEKAPAFEF
ncbi:MAG: protein-L-isoaspartate O-methyltransferase [Hyphomicrobiaceae bacterium]|nr:protein-L-isoaspartate O-methyltransferase [Hyphomicrobiaceae bacterium]